MTKKSSEEKVFSVNDLKELLRYSMEEYTKNPIIYCRKDEIINFEIKIDMTEDAINFLKVFQKILEEKLNNYFI